MLILEKADELHRHVEECQHCTTGAAEANFCYRGRVLLMAAASEAQLIVDRAAERDLLVRKTPAAASSKEPREKKIPEPNGRRVKNGVTVAAGKVRERLAKMAADTDLERAAS